MEKAVDDFIITCKEGEVPRVIGVVADGQVKLYRLFLEH